MKRSRLPKPQSPVGRSTAADPATTGAASKALVFAALLVLVFLSGYAALVYELLWFRLLRLVFGNTVQAAATVLAAFMIGLAWGAHRAKTLLRRSKNPIRLFGALEAGIGLYALVVPAAFAAASAGYKAAALHMPPTGPLLTGMRFLCALLVLFVPTALMGASLPVLAEAALRSRERFATRLGLLYGCNTAGATLGVLACGFVLLPQFGIHITNLAAAAVNLSVGAVTLLFRAPVTQTLETPSMTETSTLSPARPAGLLLVAALCGFLALAYETVWFRALVLVFGSTSQSFAIMVACFLFGLVVGSAAFGRLADQRSRAVWVLGWSLAGIGLWTFVSMLIYGAAPDWFLRCLVRFDFSWQGMLLTKAVLASLFLLPLAGLSGLAFTAVVRLIRDRTSSAGPAVGAAFGTNALGSAAGAAVGGFALLPLCGLERSLLVLGAAAIALGLIVLWRTAELLAKRRIAFTAAVLVAGTGLRLLAPPWDPLVLSSGPYFSPRTHVNGQRVILKENLASVEMLFYREGTTATVSVTRSLGGRLYFSSDGKVEADTSPPGLVLQRLIGHLPMLLHPNPRRVLNIGLGAGMTSGALTCYPDAQVEIADIEPAVTNVAALWAPQNHDLIKRGRFRLFVNDGRNHLLVTTNRYDVITSDPFEPIVAGAASLYTVEHFQLARSRLAPGGILAQFLPLYELSREDVLMILRTFVRAFPRTCMFFTGTDTILLGLTDEASFNLTTVAAKFTIPEVRNSLAEIGIDRPERLLDLLVADIGPDRAIVKEGPVNTDDLPLIEFSAPRSALEYQPDSNQQVLLDLFDEVPMAYLAGLDPGSIAQVAQGRGALRTVLQASLLRSRSELHGAKDLLTRATQQAPSNPIIRHELATTLRLLAETAQKPGEALAMYQEALRVNPNDFWTLYNLEIRARAEHQPELAAQYLRQALAAYPDAPVFLALRGRQRGMAGDVDGACRDLQAAVRGLPRRADIWHIYADFLERAGRVSESEAARKTARRWSNW